MPNDNQYMKYMKIKKYDILLADLNPKKGHVQSGLRPCIVISSNIFNEHSPTCIVVPLTTTKKKILPSEFIIQASNNNGLTTSSRFLGSHIITLDKDFFVKKLGHLEPIYYSEISEALNIALDFDDQFY